MMKHGIEPVPLIIIFWLMVFLLLFSQKATGNGNLIYLCNFHRNTECLANVV